MGNCARKPLVLESNLPPAPAKDETLPATEEMKTEGEATKEVVAEPEQVTKFEGGEAVAPAAQEGEKQEDGDNKAKSLGILLKEKEEPKEETSKDEKAEEPVVVAEPVKEEPKAEPVTTESSTPVVEAEKVETEEEKAAPVEATIPEPVKTEEPVEVVLVPTAEVVKTEEPVQAEVSTEKPSEVAAEKKETEVVEVRQENVVVADKVTAA